MGPDVGRSARLLAASLAVSWAGVQISAALGGVIALRLTGDLSLVGVPFFVFYLGSALAAYPAGHLMDRHGRIPILVGGHLLAALGFLVGAFGASRGHVLVFFAGMFIASLGAGTTYLTRQAAADLYPPEGRARGVALVVFGVSVGAVAGIPLLELAERLEDVTGRPFWLLAWLFVPLLSLTAAAIVGSIYPDPRTVALRRRDAAQTASPEAGPPRLGRALMAGVSLMLAQAAMITVMSIAGPTLDHDHYSARVIGLAMTAHLLGMFAFSPLVGRFTDRFGRRTALLTSSAILGGSMVGVIVWPSGWLPLPLLAIGLGWSFAFIAGTALVADAAGTLHGGRATGLVDVGAAIFSAAAALTSGWALGHGGLPMVGAMGLGLAVSIGFVALGIRRQPRPVASTV